MTPSNRPTTSQVARRAWELHPSLFGFLGFVVAVLGMASLLNVPLSSVLVGLGLAAGSSTALTVVVAVAQLRAEAAREVRDGSR